MSDKQTRPPTALMIAVLEELAKPNNRALFIAFPRNGESYYVLSSTMRRCTSQIDGRGFAEKFDMSRLNSDHKVRISDAGLEFLKTSDWPCRP